MGLNNQTPFKLSPPAGIPGLVLWLRADLGVFKDTGGTQPCTADGDALALWKDQSGHGNDFIIGSAPTYKTNILNGNPIIRWAGSTQYLFCNGPLNALSAWTMYFVIKNDVGSGGYVLGNTLFLGNSGWFFYGDGRYMFDQDFGAINSKLWDAGAIGSGTFRYFTNTKTSGANGVTIPTRINGTQSGSSLASQLITSDTGTQTLIMGATTDEGGPQGFFLGDMAEIIISNMALDVASTSQVENYFKIRYAL